MTNSLKMTDLSVVHCCVVVHKHAKYCLCHYPREVFVVVDDLCCLLLLFLYSAWPMLSMARYVSVVSCPVQCAVSVYHCVTSHASFCSTQVNTFFFLH